jgi:hypothetical protein
VGLRATIVGRLRKSLSPSKGVCSILPTVRRLRVGALGHVIRPGWSEGRGLRRRLAPAFATITDRRAPPRGGAEARLLASRFVRVLDSLGYARFKNWRLYGEEALAGSEAALWLASESLTLEHGRCAIAKPT